jgi:hypothetical protein
MLIVRLYGGDVDEAERARALDLMADCRECANLFADLGAIAEASAAMPVPPRPRDFALTDKDAARLRPERRAWRPAILGAGLRRSLGGSFAALGLTGALLTGAVSLLGGLGTTASSLASTDARLGAAAASNAPSQNGPDLTMTSSVPSSIAPVVAPLQSSGSDTTSGGQDGKHSTAEPFTVVPAPGSNYQYGPESQGSTSADGGGTLTAKTASPSGPSQGGIDARLVWLMAFGALFALGLAILILPWAIRRRGRGTRL